MMTKLTKILIAFIVVMSFAPLADAQYMSYSPGGASDRASPAVNNYLSARYDHLLQISPRFRRYRMWKECHTINLPPLHGDCIASFDQYEPVLPEYGWRP